MGVLRSPCRLARLLRLTVLARLHSLLGVVPLFAFVLLHVHGQWPALSGREAWADDAVHRALSGWLLALVLLAFLAHAALGARRFVREAPPAAGDLRGPPAMRGVQAGSGLVVLCFAIYHLVTLGVFDGGAHAGVRTPYARLWNGLGRPAELAIYLVGIAAVCLHLGHGLSRAAVTFRLVRSARALLLWRVVCGAIALAVFWLMLQLLAHFALGGALLPG
jgi:hypothetical protein